MGLRRDEYTSKSSKSFKSFKDLEQLMSGQESGHGSGQVSGQGRDSIGGVSGKGDDRYIDHSSIPHSSSSDNGSPSDQIRIPNSELGFGTQLGIWIKRVWGKKLHRRGQGKIPKLKVPGWGMSWMKMCTAKDGEKMFRASFLAMLEEDGQGIAGLDWPLAYFKKHYEHYKGLAVEPREAEDDSDQDEPEEINPEEVNEAERAVDKQGEAQRAWDAVRPKAEKGEMNFILWLRGLVGESYSVGLWIPGVFILRLRQLERGQLRIYNRCGEPSTLPRHAGLPNELAACCEFMGWSFRYIVPRWNGTYEDCRDGRDMTDSIGIISEIWRRRPTYFDGSELMDWIETELQKAGVR